jgi:hypothetical protein
MIMSELAAKIHQCEAAGLGKPDCIYIGFGTQILIRKEIDPEYDPSEDTKQISRLMGIDVCVVGEHHLSVGFNVDIEEVKND